MIEELFTPEELALLSYLDSVPTDLQSVQRQVNTIDLQIQRHAVAVARRDYDGKDYLKTEDYERLLKTRLLLEGKPTQIQTINNTPIAETDLDNNKLENLLRGFGTKE